MYNTNTWDEMIELGDYVEEIIKGETIKSIKWNKVYANKKSVRQSEFYEARNLGLKPELVFEVHSFEFNNLEKVRYKNEEYDIIRVYDKGEITEIIVTSFTGVEV